jgi:urease accessory protein UreF
MTRSNTNSWITAMLSDSSLPVGGFVASLGLESALQQNLVSESSLLDWILQSLYLLHHQTCPFVLAIYEISDCLLPEQFVEEIAKLDKFFHVRALLSIIWRAISSLSKENR